MIRIHADCLSLPSIAESGQCFRWERRRDGYRIVAMDRVLFVRQGPGREETEFSCSPEEFDRVWKNYFDLDTDYLSIIRAIPGEDAYLRAAAAYGQGIRILRQDPWETLVTFILSQRKNIPAIRQAVEKLCAACGKKIGEDEKGFLYAFPSPEELVRLDESALRSLGLGYRAPYIRRTAEAFSGPKRMDQLCSLNDRDLLEELCSFYGVGRKIALCTMLFGFHRMNAFPVDVWMGRIAEKRYPQGIPTEKYFPWAGVMQQYMFAYERHLAEKAPKNIPHRKTVMSNEERRSFS